MCNKKILTDISCKKYTEYNPLN